MALLKISDGDFEQQIIALQGQVVAAGGSISVKQRISDADFEQQIIALQNAAAALSLPVTPMYRIADTEFEQQLVLLSGLLGAGTYLGQLATRSYVPNTFSTTNKQLMSRNGHIARTNMSSFQIDLPNWYAGSGLEHTTGADATVTAAIEFPVGTFKQVLFSGTAIGGIPDGTTLRSDPINLSIPTGSKFFSRIFFQNSAGVLQHWTNAASLGEGANQGVSGVVDATMGGAISGNVFGYGPIGIIGQTSQPTILLLGDSRGFGQGDTVMTGNVDLGELARSIGPTFAYQNMCVPGDAIQFYLLNSVRRRAAINCSHVVVQHAINDFRNSRTALNIEADLASALAQLPAGLQKPGRAFLSTTPPQTSSTDSWATLVNQTPSLPAEAQRVTLNNWKRGVPAGFAGCFEIADVTESARDSGKWIVNGTANFGTTDGLHATSAVYVLIAGSGNINPSVFHF